MERDKHVGFVLQGFSDGGSTPPASNFFTVLQNEVARILGQPKGGF